MHILDKIVSLKIEELGEGKDLEDEILGYEMKSLQISFWMHMENILIYFQIQEWIDKKR